MVAAGARVMIGDVLEERGRETARHRRQRCRGDFSPPRRSAEEFRTNLDLLRHPIPTALWADMRQAGLLHPKRRCQASAQTQSEDSAGREHARGKRRNCWRSAMRVVHHLIESEH
jgi:hypothetical protein